MQNLGFLSRWALAAIVACHIPYHVAWAQDTQPGQAQIARDAVATLNAVADELAKEPDLVVGQVAGTPITRAQVADRIRELSPLQANVPPQTLYRAVLQQLLRQQALVAQARKHGLDQDPVAQRRMKQAADNALANEYLRRSVLPEINDQTLHAVYAREIAGKPGPEMVRARIIAVPTEPEARALAGQLASGADFADVARRASKDPTAATGGDLGFVRRDTINPEIGAVLFALTPGQTTQMPVRVGEMYFILRVEERRQSGAPEYEAARAGLTSDILRAATPAAIQAAMTGLKIEEYPMTGRPGGQTEEARRLRK